MPLDNFFKYAPQILEAAAKSLLGIFALMILCVSVLGYFLFRKSSEKTRIAIFVLMFVGVSFFGFAILYAVPNRRTDIVNNKETAYGLKIKRNVWKHYYLENYNFRGEIEYLVENVSEGSVLRLLPYKAGWFGWNIETPVVKTEIYGDATNLYNIEVENFTKQEISRRDIDGRENHVTMYDWQFKITPPLEPNKALHYGIIINTSGTERDAFDSENGSWAGMASPLPVDLLGCEIYAPENYKFLNKGYVVKDYAGRIIEVKNLHSPEFSRDGSKISWQVENPSPALQYLVKIAIAKTN